MGGASTHAYRAYVLHPRPLELARDAGGATCTTTMRRHSCSGRPLVLSRGPVRVRASRTTPVSPHWFGGLMRKQPRRITWLMVACAAAAAASPGRAQQVDPYPQTLQFGAG